MIFRFVKLGVDIIVRKHLGLHVRLLERTLEFLLSRLPTRVLLLSKRCVSLQSDVVCDQVLHYVCNPVSLFIERFDSSLER